ncbi:hypothetical protein ACFL4G_06090, partial [Thermodesulfobacteriota bacterium]
MTRPILLFLATVFSIAILAGCQPVITIESPLADSVQEGIVSVRVSWDSSIDPTGFSALINDTDITGEFSFPEPSVAEAELSLVPGKKFLSIILPNAPITGNSASSIFTATSTCPREEFAGGFLSYTCESSFFHLPIAVPGLDPGLGLTEFLCDMLPISGVFPAGTAEFPKSPFLPILFGIFPRQVNFDEDTEVPNGISIDQ